jgi:metallo-beta-lactamase class B
MMTRKSMAAQAVRAALAVAMVMAIPALAHAQAGAPPANPPAQNSGMPNLAQSAAAMKEPFPPFHIIGNINYVGSKGISCYLITTPAGEILIDTGYPDMAEQIEGNIQKLGYKLSDVKIIIDSHSHIDHAGGIAAVKAATGATLMSVAEDAVYLESGGHNDVLFGDRNLFPAVKVDRVLHDGEAITLGGVTLTPHLTPGHTPGNTTWTMVTEDKGKSYNVVFWVFVSLFPNASLKGTPSYPNMGADVAKTMKVIPTIKCDVFLGSNSSFFNMEQKHDALMKGADPNPFIDPQGCKEFVERAEASYQAALQRDQAAATTAPVK